MAPCSWARLGIDGLQMAAGARIVGLTTLQSAGAAAGWPDASPLAPLHGMDSAEDGIGGSWERKERDIRWEMKGRVKLPETTFSSHLRRPKRRFVLTPCGVGPSLVGNTGSGGSGSRVRWFA